MIYFYFIFLIFLSAFFSASEIAFFSLSPAQIRLLKDKKKKYFNIVWYLKNHPYNTLITILLGNNIVNIFTASLATYVSVKIFGSLGVGVATGVVTFIILVFGEIIPKSFAHKNNIVIAQISSPIIYGLYIIFWPVIRFLRLFNIVIQKLFKVPANEFLTEEEIKTLARLGVESGKIDYREHEMIGNVFKLNDITAKEVMTPRYKIVFLNGQVPVEQIAHFIAQSGYSRFPVFEDEEEKIIGYIHVNQVMKILNSEKRDKLLRDFISPLPTVLANKKIDSILRFMLRKKIHMTQVQKNSREIVGIITLEDILEQLVGNISDETDKNQEI